MKKCVKCLYTENHPLNLIFDANGVCSGCRVHEEKDTLDWPSRFARLKRIVNNYKSKTRQWDCIVPVSGASDSYFTLHVVKTILGLNPLLVTYNKHYNTRLGIRNLAYLRTKFDCDMVMKTVDPSIVKSVTLETLDRIGSIYWHILAGQTALPVQIATKFDIPLIIWGVHQGLDQVGMFSHLDEVEMTAKYRREHDLMGLDEEYLVDSNPKLTPYNLEAFTYPSPAEISKTGVRGIYLGNFIRWDSKAQHEQMIKIYDYESRPAKRTIDPYNYSDCHHYTGLHDYIKYQKHGYGKITDNLSREIRFGRIDRENAKKIADSYKNIKPNDLKLFSRWIGLSEQQILQKIELHKMRTNVGLFDYHNLIDRQENLFESLYLKNPTKKFLESFVVTPTKDERQDNEYILFAKGFTK